MTKRKVQKRTKRRSKATGGQLNPTTERKRHLRKKKKGPYSMVKGE